MQIVAMLVAALTAAFGAVMETIGGGDGGVVAATAERGVQFDLSADCDLDTVEALAERHPEVGQFVVMATDTWAATTGTVEVAARTDDGWQCQRGSQAAAYGRAGTRPLLDRLSGDDTTPAGVFPLGLVTAWDGQQLSMFGNLPDPGVLAPYRDVRPEDCWGATKSTARYQHLVNRPRCPGPDDEWLAGITESYSHAAVIGANLDPISGDEPGETPYAAAIFLHRHSYANGVAKPTSGCVSLGYDDLVATLRLIDPRLDPHFAIGPTDWLRTSA
jgi:L,D-peptidoglycan transpeptidase YkuD (ErfK/YbiS/YcfS/YnhG family)